LKKGNLIYICLVNNREKLADDKPFTDEIYREKQIEIIYGKQPTKLASTKNTFSTSTAMHPSQFKISKKRQRHESSSYVRKQLEYLHIQFVSLVTGNVNAQLKKKPNLDIKTSIQGLERTIDMMCEVS